jgi:hypothetical protein
MKEALEILTRYSLISVATYLVTSKGLDEGLIEPLVGAGMAAFTLGWVLYSRYFNKTK